MTAASLPAGDLRAPPVSDDFIGFASSFGRRFMLVVDTEEEFDWNAPFSRESRSVTIADAMRHGQDYFARAGVRPLYVADYPVIDNPRVGAMLAGWAATGAADVGAHCHPWVNPPHSEDVTRLNSFAGNLPEALEREKLTLLRDRITEVTGKAPIAFRAGRYGIGPNTGRILHDLGFLIDTSVRSRFSYVGEGGPDFSGMPVRPWRAGPGGTLVELPLSTAFCGALRHWGRRLLPVIGQGGGAAGMLSRAGLLQRVPLTPEGVSAAEAIRAIDSLLNDDLRLLMFSFHSPTLAPGNTPYVRTERDLQDFYRWWGRVLDHLARRGVESASLDQVIAACGR